jgi:hypothetical protein
MSFEDLPSGRERRSRLPAFDQYGDSPLARYEDSYTGYSGYGGQEPQGPPWDPPPRQTESYPPLRVSRPFEAVPDRTSVLTAKVRGRGVLAGAVAGFLSAAVALGVANLVAAFVRPQASPVIAVGGAFVDRTPSWLKNFAVQRFGENDKTMLLVGMYVTIALIAIVIGMLASRHVTVGILGIALFGAFGAFVAVTRPASQVTDVIPSIAGGLVGVVAILWLVRFAIQNTGYRTHRGYS